jgi:hypothetical protein
MTSNMIYIVALGVGFKCPRKIHLNTQWGGGGGFMALPAARHLEAKVLYVRASFAGKIGFAEKKEEKK